ncbi:MAG: hypothetical protein ACI9OJ_005096, partial [Myxococcota bacterium]
MLRALVILVTIAPMLAKATVPLVSDVSVEFEGARYVLKATVTAGTRSIEGADLLVAIGPTADTSDALSALSSDGPPQQPAMWRRLRSGREAGTIELGPLQPAPRRTDEYLLLTRGAHTFLRLSVARLNPEESRIVTRQVQIRTRRPGTRVSASVTSYVLSEVTLDDFVALPAQGATGLASLARSVGLTGRGDIGGRLGRADDELRDAVAGFVAEQFEHPDESVHPYGVAAALWLLPQLSPKSFIALAEGHLVGSPNAFEARFDAAVAADKLSKPLRWVAAVESVVPRRGRGGSLTRIFALSMFLMEPPWNGRLLEALAAADPNLSAQADDFMAEAGAGMLAGLDRWPTDLVKTALAALAKWRVADALIIVFGWRSQPAFEAAVSAIGRTEFVKSATQMVRGGVPIALMDALASPLLPQRKTALEILTASGPAANDAIATYLRRLGHGNRVGTSLDETLSRLQGVLLGDLAKPYHDEAWRIHLHGGDCVPALERALAEVHPELLLPEPLYARCRAMRAIILLEEPDGLAKAEALVDAARKDAPGDPKVESRYITVKMARVTRLLEDGHLYDAEVLVDELDPDQTEPSAVGVRADIQMRLGREALDSGDREGAIRFFTEARRLDPHMPPAATLMIDDGRPMRHLLYSLVSILLTAGLCALMLLWLLRFRAASDFDLDADEKATTLSGPGGRKLIVAPHGLLAMRRLGYTMVSWNDVEAAYLLTGTNDRSGLLLWIKGGIPFVIPIPMVHRFDLFVDLATQHLKTAGVRMVLTRPMSNEIVLVNDAVVDKLQS